MKKEKLDRIISILREQPTMNMGAGKIAGSAEAGDDPPVRKKKRYIYGGRGSRKMWAKDDGK
tara:strand:- start:16 stop:201 length:186 start_codon:yes stop_codon:yes gene_type:complete